MCRPSGFCDLGDLQRGFGPYTTCYNRFVRWRRAGVWTRIITALALAITAGEAHDSRLTAKLLV